MTTETEKTEEVKIDAEATESEYQRLLAEQKGTEASPGTQEAPSQDEEVTPEAEDKAAPAEKDETPAFLKSQEEYDLAVAQEVRRVSQSEIDKRLAPLQQERDDLRKENERVMSVLGIEEAAELDQWTDVSDREVKDFQKKRRDLISRAAALDKYYEELNQKIDEVNKVADENEVEAFVNQGLRDARGLSPEDSVAFADGLRKALQEECGTTRERELMTKLKAREANASNREDTQVGKPAPRKPDSSRPGPIGGMSDSDWYEKVYALGKSDDHARAKKIHDKMVKGG